MDLVLKEAGLPAASPTANGASGANGASDRVALAHQHPSISFPSFCEVSQKKTCHRSFLGILHKPAVVFKGLLWPSVQYVPGPEVSAEDKLAMLKGGHHGELGQCGIPQDTPRAGP
jgi:hypothetical protein